MKNYRPILLIILFIAVLILLKILFFPGAQPAGTGMKGKNQGPAKPVAVHAFIVSEKEIDNTFYTNGTLLPNEKSNIQSEVNGTITGLYFKEGKQVTKGQLLVQVNDAEWRAQYKKLESQLKLAQQKKDRYEKLLSSGAVSQEEYEGSIAEFGALQAESDLISAQLAKTQIRAPFTGVLGFRKISPGSYVSQGAIIGEIVQNVPLKVEFSVPEKYAGGFSDNSPVSFTTETDNRTYQAQIYAIEPQINETSRTVGFHALYPNTNKELLPGGFVRVTISADKKNRGILIPTQAIIPVLKGKKVLVVRKGKATDQEIETGLRTDKMIQVTRGLQVGDTVITTGIMSLSNGSPVTFIEILK